MPLPILLNPWCTVRSKIFIAVPGQFVRINVPAYTQNESTMSDTTGPSGQQYLSPIVNSPYAVRRDSADLDASLIEVTHPTNLAGLPPSLHPTFKARCRASI